MVRLPDTLARQFPLRSAVLASLPAWILLFWAIPESADPGRVLLVLGAFASSVLGVASLGGTLRRERESVREVREEMEHRVSRHALDENTGTLTRRVFIERAELRLRRREPSESFAFLVIDLDHLKVVNDSFGHKAGDALLQRLANVLRGIAPRALTGRIGGDEFAVLLPCRSEGELDAFTAELYGALAEPLESGGRRFTLSASVGAVLVPAQALYLTQAVQFADLALYEAKRQGRGRLVHFDETMLRALKRHRLIERELRAALLLNELDLHYQPIVDADGRLYALEALMRWESPSRGAISPAEFIRVAEGTTLIDQLGSWALARACRDALEFGDVRVCVNVSAVQLKRDDVVSAVQQALRSTGLAPERLVLELTESVAIEATPALLERLERLRAMGVAIALDDFGTGFSGFDYLRHLPVDKIKIDRSYVARLGESEADNVLVSALANVARAMHMSVVAEGIETEAQMILARSAGASLFQGYHVARPAPKASVVANWIEPAMEADRRAAGAQRLEVV